MKDTYLIGLHGRAGAGKDTLANLLGFETYAFARPLKTALAVMGFPEPERADKEKLISGFSFSWRRAAQTLGTEWGRALQGDIWLAMAKRFHARCTHDFLVITDVRFHNEADWIRGNGVLVHVIGRVAADQGAIEQQHASELSLPRQPEDIVVDNSGTIDDLR